MNQSTTNTAMRKPERILMLLENQSYPDDSRVKLEAESLTAAGYQVHVICPTGQSTRRSERIRGVKVYRYPQPPQLEGFVGYLVEYSYSIAMLFLGSLVALLRHGFDAVHVHTPPDMTGVIGIFYKVLLRKRFVFDHHDLSPELYSAKSQSPNSTVVKALYWFEGLSCRWADRLIATNQTQHSIHTDRCKVDKEKCFVVRNGPNELFLNTPSKANSDSGSVLTIGYVGIIGVQDGLDFLIRALYDLKTRLGRSDFRAIVVGDGPALKEIRALAEELELGELVEFTGKVPFEEVPNHIARFDICATPDPSNSYNDSCTTIKTMEYMALGKPTVCFETLENQRTAGESAVYAKNNCVESFADALASLMDAPDRRAELGALARRRIHSGLTWHHQSENLIALYDGLFGVTRLTEDNASDELRVDTVHDIANDTICNSELPSSPAPRVNSVEEDSAVEEETLAKPPPDQTRANANSPTARPATTR